MLRIETTRQRISANQPPATAQSGLDTSAPGSYLARPDYSTSETFRWSSSGTRDEGAPCCASRPPGNGSARTDPQRQPGVVSLRRGYALGATAPAPALAGARGGTRPARRSAGRVAARATKERCAALEPSQWGVAATERDHSATDQRRHLTAGRSWTPTRSRYRETPPACTTRPSRLRPVATAPHAWTAPSLRSVGFRHRSGARGRRRSASRGGGRRGGRPARGRRRSRTRCGRSATAGSPTAAAPPTCG